jgi:hypothetical protein
MLLEYPIIFSQHQWFNDGQQDYRFYVSAVEFKMDCIATEDGEDFSGTLFGIVK